MGEANRPELEILPNPLMKLMPFVLGMIAIVSEGTNRRQGAALTAGKLVHALSVDGGLSLLPSGKVDLTRERIGVVEFAWAVRVPAGAAAPALCDGN